MSLRKSPLLLLALALVACRSTGEAEPPEPEPVAITPLAADRLDVPAEFSSTAHGHFEQMEAALAPIAVIATVPPAEVN